MTKLNKFVSIRMDERMYNRIEKVVEASQDIKMTRGEVVYTILRYVLDQQKQSDDMQAFREWVMTIRDEKK